MNASSALARQTMFQSELLEHVAYAGLGQATFILVLAFGHCQVQAPGRIPVAVQGIRMIDWNSFPCRLVLRKSQQGASPDAGIAAVTVLCHRRHRLDERRLQM